jgi:hypothetical protein
MTAAMRWLVTAATVVAAIDVAVTLYRWLKPKAKRAYHRRKKKNAKK